MSRKVSRPRQTSRNVSPLATWEHSGVWHGWPSPCHLRHLTHGGSLQSSNKEIISNKALFESTRVDQCPGPSHGGMLGVWHGATPMLFTASYEFEAPRTTKATTPSSTLLSKQHTLEPALSICKMGRMTWGTPHAYPQHSPIMVSRLLKKIHESMGVCGRQATFPGLFLFIQGSLIDALKTCLTD